MWQEFQANLWLYISIPFISGLIGYITKVVAIEMMFSPLEFVGIKPIFGWQGIVSMTAPRPTNRVCGKPCQILRG